MARVSTACVNFTEGSMMERSMSSDLSLSFFFITKVVNCDLKSVDLSEHWSSHLLSKDNNMLTL